MNKLSKTLPNNDRRLRWIAVAVTVLIAGLISLWGIYGIKEYGLALFILTPIFIGACPSVIYGLKKEMSRQDAWMLGLVTLGVFTVGLLIFAIEGLICIAMAAPIGIILTWVGSLIGHAIITKKPGSATNVMLIFVCAIPSTAFIEKGYAPALTSVVTSIEIKASPEVVWNNVVEFPQLNQPTEFIFKTGIAYPINATIEGKGIGAIRYCNFTTGSFVEPITVWDENKLLSFNVAEQPAPMKEISFWDINAPHLHDYFVSKKGQFKLSVLPNGNTLLEGTTWYYHRIKPAFYWQIWSNYIIHKIHERVLNHIKDHSEDRTETSKISINNSHHEAINCRFYIF